MKTNVVTISATNHKSVAANPWLLVSGENHVINLFASRNVARGAKAAGCRVVNAKDVKFSVTRPARDKGAKTTLEILRASTIENPCLFVWDTAIAMKGARRKDVIAACIKAGVAYYTARTQYQKWLESTRA